MYHQHYGLRFPPFKITPDTELFFAGGRRGLVLDALGYAVNEGEGIVKVVGEVGSGKTMLCRMLIERLGTGVDIAYLANPRLTPDTILQAVALELGVKEASGSRLEVLHALHQTLLDRHGQGRRVVALVEEAQGMPLDTLEEIRLLSNLETGREKLLQIVLFGQPELDENLSRQRIRQLRERITHHFYLEPLRQREIAEYLDFRMRGAGYQGPPVFSPAVVKTITRASEGLLRRVNILADKALLAAFTEVSPQVTVRHARMAQRDSRLQENPAQTRWWWPLALVVVLLAAGGWWSDRWLPRAVEVSPPSPTRVSPTEKQLAAGRAWLAAADPARFTVQLMEMEPASNPLLPTPWPADLHLLAVVAKDRPVWRLTYGEFLDRRAAKRALDDLPPDWRENAPFIRTVGSLQGLATE